MPLWSDSPRRKWVAPLFIAVLGACQVATAQENRSNQSDGVARTGVGAERPAAQAPEPQQRAAVVAADSPAASQPPEKEAIAILELGAQPARSLSGGGWTLSPTVAVEATPIEKWLEVEVGVTPTFTHRSTEWDTDFLIKKPWDLSKKVEFMFGAGPVWIHSRENGVASNSVAGEIAADFMIWPSPKRRFGWYIEPAYDYTFGRSHDQGISVSIGLLISVR